MAKRPELSICVFTGSRPGASPKYAQAAMEFSEELVKRGLGLVYGGGNVGLMNVVANTMLEHGGYVIGVIPDALVSKEVAHTGLSELRVVHSMHERKALMAELAAGFVALPGGIGTMEEFFEVLSWAQLGLHNKPCGLLNIGGYYDSLVEFLDHAVAEDFLKPKHRVLLIVENQINKLLDRFEAIIGVPVAKKFDPSIT
ncbi:MAG TPA: TIGR00730 family Rossman fold protein [Candidatus Binatia bacterium]